MQSEYVAQIADEVYDLTQTHKLHWRVSRAKLRAACKAAANAVYNTSDWHAADSVAQQHMLHAAAVGVLAGCTARNS